jgi:hypothetical protein
MALGLTMQLPLDDKHSYHKEYLEAQLAILMGGRIAEELFMHHITTGAGNDIERATDMARKMVCEWGMSELGPLSFGKREEQIFLGREIAQHRDYSEATAIRIDEQVKKLVQDGHDRARKIIEENTAALERIAMALLEREVLDGGEVKQLIDGEKLTAIARTPPSTPGRRRAAGDQAGASPASARHAARGRPAAGVTAGVFPPPKAETEQNQRGANQAVRGRLRGLGGPRGQPLRKIGHELLIAGGRADRVIDHVHIWNRDDVRPPKRHDVLEKHRCPADRLAIGCRVERADARCERVRHRRRQRRGRFRTPVGAADRRENRVIPAGSGDVLADEDHSAPARYERDDVGDFGC